MDSWEEFEKDLIAGNKCTLAHNSLWDGNCDGIDCDECSKQLAEYIINRAKALAGAQ